MTPEKTIGNNIRFYREINGYTQDTVSNFLSVKREMISYHENGIREIPFDVLTRLSDLYRVDMASFYEDDKKLVWENVTVHSGQMGLRKMIWKQLPILKQLSRII